MRGDLKALLAELIEFTGLLCNTKWGCYFCLDDRIFKV